jgi:hypothetical protein
MKGLTGFVCAVVLAVGTVACSQTDSGTTARIQAKFAQDDIVKAHEIDVTTNGGVVTLEGEVDNNAARQQAVRLARETQGVTSVIDNLRVEVSATTGDRDDVDVDVDPDGSIERGAEATGDAIKKGADATADAAKKTGRAVRDAVTDDDPDTDKDGK